jgi:hypothetical protein
MVFAVDLGLAFVLFLSLIAGLRNGFLDTLISIAAWLGSLLVAVYLSEPILVRLPEWARSVPGAGVVLGVLLFLISFAAIRLIGHAAGAGEHEATDAGDRELAPGADGRRMGSPRERRRKGRGHPERHDLTWSVVPPERT